ncbi:MAG: hypothetical protein LBF57_03765, partial [Holosporaceae bacterium]|nr:hypothetical protein [Holosporaceae bacterium]
MIRKFLESLLLKKNNLRKNHGYVMILVAVSIPIFLFAIDYSIKKNKQSHTHVTQKIAAYAVGEAVIKKYQPGKKWSDQIKLVYSFATQALNDKGFVLVKNMIIPTLSISVKSYDINMYPLKQSEVYFYASSYGLLNGYPLSSHALSHEDTLFCDKPPFRQNVSGNDIILTAYTTQQRSDAYNVVFSDPNDEINKQKMELSLDRSNCRIKCDCKCLQKKVYAYPPKCNVDIVMTLPTNDDINQSIPEISAAYQNFLEEDFLHANGVAVGLVPYSGKISISKQQSDWITEPAMEDTPTISNKLYIKQAALYGSEGKCGSPLSFGYYSKNALPLLHIPIMARYGSREDYNGVPIYTGYDMLLSTDNPLISPFHGFRRANLNPCYLGYCNFLSGKCEKECTTFLPNPFFITELTDDLQGVINDLNIIGPVIDDLYNRSNFVFLAVLFSHILLKDWTAYPSTNIKELGKFVHPPRTEKKKAVILLVNEPDRFEPNELTYLGFDNDFSEIPMIESDCIRFDIDYSDTSRKFANGSSYDGIIMG